MLSDKILAMRIAARNHIDMPVSGKPDLSLTAQPAIE